MAKHKPYGQFDRVCVRCGHRRGAHYTSMKLESLCRPLSRDPSGQTFEWDGETYRRKPLPWEKSKDPNMAFRLRKRHVK